MAEKEINLRRLVIKAFHMTDVEWGDEKQYYNGWPYDCQQGDAGTVDSRR